MHGLKNSISSLVIETTRKQGRSTDADTHVFGCIFNMFINLQYLNFSSFFLSCQRISFGFSLPTVFSPCLLELHVKVVFVDDCLYLLDGRFNQLQALYVDIAFSSPRSMLKINKVLFLMNVINIYFICFRESCRICDVLHSIAFRKYISMIQ